MARFDERWRLGALVLVTLVVVGWVAVNTSLSPRLRAILSDGGFSPDPPPAGTFSIHSVTSTSFLSAVRSLNPHGERVSFEVRYQGPKEVAELVFEHWEGATLVRESILWSHRFGSVKRTVGPNSVSYDDGRAFLQTVQRFTVWLEELPEPYPDGRNALLRLAVAAPSQLDTISSKKSLVEVWTSEAGQYGSQMFPHFDSERKDDTAVEVWSQSRRAGSASSGGGPPYPDGQFVDRILFRLRE